MSTTQKTQPETVTNKISAGYLKRIDDACTDLRFAWEQLEAAVTEFNEEMQQKYQTDVVSLLDDYNAKVEEANELRGSIADDMQNYFDNKSEKWQESDKGQEYQAWMERWQEEFETVSIEEPTELDFDVPNYADNLGEDLPVEVGG